MKTLKVLTIVAITGLVGVVSANACPSGGENKAQCQKNKQETCQTKKQEACQTKKQKSCQNNKHQKGVMKETFQKLELTSEQKSAMKSHRKDMRKQMQAKRAQMHGERGMAGMSKFVSAKGFDKQGFMDMASQRSKKMAQRRADMFEKKISILTAEQRVKLVSLLQEKQK